MDLSQSLKLGVKIIHQRKKVDRLLKNKEHRQMKRNDLVSAKRHISDSPLRISPEPEKKMTRLELLRKWQEERNKRKAAEKSKVKPAFKVSHVSEKIYEEVAKLPPVCLKKEPTPSSYKFASSAHKFRVPPNIKPLHLDGGRESKKNAPIEDNAVEKNEKTRRKLNFKMNNILPSKENLNLDTVQAKTSQREKTMNRKIGSVPKPSEPGTSHQSKATSKISSTQGPAENLNMISTKTSNPPNVRLKSARLIAKSNNAQLKTEPEVKTKNSNQKLVRQTSSSAVSKPKIAKSGSDQKQKSDVTVPKTKVQDKNQKLVRQTSSSAVLKSKTVKSGSDLKQKSNTKVQQNNQKLIGQASSSAVSEPKISRSGSDLIQKSDVAMPKTQVQQENSDVSQGLRGNLRSSAVQRKSSTPKKENSQSGRVVPKNADENYLEKISPVDKKVMSEEDYGLNSAFNKDESDLVTKETEKESRSVEKSEVPHVLTRAMSRAQQLTTEKQTSRNSLVADIVQIFEEGGPKTKSVSPKKRQIKASIDNEVLSKSAEFAVPVVKTPNKVKPKANDENMNTNEEMEVKNIKTGSKTPTNRRKSLHSDPEIPSFQTDASFKSMSPDYPIERSFGEIINASTPNAKDIDVTPDNDKEAINYVSPYVTMSRGKNSARKEFHKRQSKGGLCDASPEVTGAKAGAAYFYKVLDDEILRIQNMCQEWTTYKDKESDLPEEACDMINTALGQSGLLISKRMKQFRGLIDSCHAQNSDPLITCMDLHGYWDLLLIQVKNLDLRFDNLVKLRSNDWEEVLPEKKIVKCKVTIKRPAKKASAKPSNLIRNAIKAARLKVQGCDDEQNVFDGGFFAVKSPMKSNVMAKKSPLLGRKSLLKVVGVSDVKMRMESSGLAMCRATRKSRSMGVSGNETKVPESMTPVKSILKTKEPKSSVKKAVLFEEDVNKEETKNKSYVVSNDNDENDVNSPNVPSPIDTPRRLTRNRLF